MRVAVILSHVWPRAGTGLRAGLGGVGLRAGLGGARLRAGLGGARLRVGLGGARLSEPKGIVLALEISQVVH